MGLQDALQTVLARFRGGRIASHSIHLICKTVQMKQRWYRAYKKLKTINPGSAVRVVEPGIDGAPARHRPALPADLAQRLVTRWVLRAIRDITARYAAVAATVAQHPPSTTSSLYDSNWSSSDSEDQGGDEEDEEEDEDEDDDQSGGDA